MPDLPNLVARSLKELSTAVKAAAFYPTHHPAVVASLDRLAVTLREALTGRETLKIGVSETIFLLDRDPLASDDRTLSGFATYLSRRGVGALAIKPPLELASLRGLVEVVAIEPATLRSRGGPARCLAERRLEGVTIEEFNPATTLKMAKTGEAVPGAERGRPVGSWSDLMAGFLIGTGPAPPAGSQHLMRRIAGDEVAARQIMASLQALTAGSTPAERGRILASAMGRVAAEVATAEPEALASLAKNLASALSEVEPEVRVEILNSTIPVPGTSTDLGREIRLQMPAERIGELITALVRTQGKLSPRLTSVVRKVLIDSAESPGKREEIGRAIQASRGPKDDALAEVWSRIEGLLEESEDLWLAREYKGFLELLADRPPALSEELRRELLALPGLMESFSEGGIRRRAWCLYGDLLDFEVDPERLRTVLGEIEKRTSGLQPDWFVDAGGAATGARRLLGGWPTPGPAVKEAAERMLKSLAARLIACYRERFHALPTAQREALAKALDALGPFALEALLLGLEQEQDWEVRKTFLSFLTALGREAVPALTARLSHPSWYLVRNLLVILGEIGDATTIPAIGPTLNHSEPRVRRDAVAALGKIGGPRAFALVRESLGDPEVAEVARRCLAGMDRPRTVATFLEMTDQVHILGRRNARLRDAITALGELGAPEAVPRLESILLRDLWLPLSAGDTVRIAAARALAKIGTTDALSAVARGSKVWRRAVRYACSEIVSQRPAAGNPIPQN